MENNEISVQQFSFDAELIRTRVVLSMHYYTVNKGDYKSSIPHESKDIYIAIDIWGGDKSQNRCCTQIEVDIEI